MVAIAGNSRADWGAFRGQGRKTSWQQYALAVLLAIGAFGIRYWLRFLLGDELPFMLFIAGALVSAWYGGAVAGFLTLGLGFLLGEYFLHPPKGIVHGLDSVELLRLFRYLFTSALGIILIDRLRRGEYRATMAAAELRREVERRRASEAALERAKTTISRHADELELRVAERTAELSASVQSLEGILYHIAHNFRAPVRAMEGFVTLLEREYGSNWDATARDYANRISTSARQMERLIQDLLSYGRLTHMNLQLTRISPDEAIKQALSKLTRRSKDTNAEITIKQPLPCIWADEQILQQVLLQLFDNAIKFVPTGTRPRIRVWAEHSDGMVRLWIEDNGIGIDPRYHERIFLPFERQKVVAGHEGNGVGLAIVREGVQRMGGQVGVESHPPAGSRFWLKLPSCSHSPDSRDASEKDRQSEGCKKIPAITTNP